MRTIESLIESIHSDPCHVFEAECCAWADDPEVNGESDLRAFLDGGGDQKVVLSILSALSRACESELDLTVPSPVEEEQPDGSIRITTPMESITRFFPDRYSSFEALFAELRD